MPMHAHVVRIRVPADRLDEFAQRVGASAATLPALADLGDLPGFRHGYLLVDRQRGEALAVTLLDTPEHRAAGAPPMREVLGGAAAATGAEVGTLAAYELAVAVSPATD